MGIYLSMPPIFLADNLLLLQLSIKHTSHSFIKHIDIDYQFVPWKVAIGSLNTQYILLSKQLASCSYQTDFSASIGKTLKQIGCLANHHQFEEEC